MRRKIKLTLSLVYTSVFLVLAFSGVLQTQAAGSEFQVEKPKVIQQSFDQC